MKNTKPYVPKVRDLDALVGGSAAPAAPAPVPAPAADDEPRINFTTRIPAQLRRRFKAACVERGVSMETAVAEALAAWIAGRQ